MIVLLSVSGIIFLWILFSGLLFRIFLNTLLTFGTILLTCWIILFLGGALLAFGLPIICGATDRDLVMVYNRLLNGDWDNAFKK